LPGSKGDPNRSPRWFKQALGTIEEREANRLWFVPNLMHRRCAICRTFTLALKVILIAEERAYRGATAVKREFRRQRKAERAERASSRGLKLAA
jgi:hypothetical protein